MSIAKAGKMNDLLKNKAKLELNEDPEQIEAYLKSLRRWLVTVKYIKCPNTREFLLPFLRHSKYNLVKAEERIDNYCTLIKSPVYGKPEWFHRLENAEHLRIFKSLMTHIPLGFLGDDGPLVMLFRFGKFDYSLLPQEYLTNGIHMITEYFLRMPRVQISGSIALMDCSQMNSRILKQMNDTESNKIMTRWFQDSLPMRMKGLYYFNEPEAFHALFKVFSVFLTEKVKSRITFCGKDFDKVKKKIPGVEKILPKEYQGNAGTLEELTDKFYDSMLEYNKTHPDYEISIDESKRETKPSLQKYENTGAYVKTTDEF